MLPFSSSGEQSMNNNKEGKEIKGDIIQKGEKS
jgi:hypothetical protein